MQRVLRSYLDHSEGSWLFLNYNLTYFMSSNFDASVNIISFNTASMHSPWEVGYESEMQQRRSDLRLCSFWIDDFRKCVIFVPAKMGLNSGNFDTV